MSHPVFKPKTKYDPGVGEWYAISTRLLHPKEHRPRFRPGVWFVWRHKSVFVHETKLAKAVTGTSYGNDLDLMRQAVELAIEAHKKQPYDMTVSLSQRSIYERIRSQL